jgi:hypothetical protein
MSKTLLFAYFPNLNIEGKSLVKDRPSDTEVKNSFLSRIKRRSVITRLLFVGILENVDDFCKNPKFTNTKVDIYPKERI